MAKDLSKHQEGIVKRYYEHHETIQSDKVSQIVSDLYLAEDDKARTKLWGRVQIALMRLNVDATLLANVVRKRDLEALAKIAADVDAGRPSKAPPPESAGEAPCGDRSVGEARRQRAAQDGHDSLEDLNLKRALKAFRRKLKTLRRDDESRLGNRYVTSGRTSEICAITPPDEFPAPVWQKLAELGRLKDAGGGTYELP